MIDFNTYLEVTGKELRNTTLEEDCTSWSLKVQEDSICVVLHYLDWSEGVGKEWVVDRSIIVTKEDVTVQPSEGDGSVVTHSEALELFNAFYDEFRTFMGL